jgi:hypothetical protein
MAWLLLCFCVQLLSSARLGRTIRMAISREIASPDQAPSAPRMIVMLQNGRVMCLGRSKTEIAVVIVKDFSVSLPISGTAAMPLLRYTSLA